MEEKATWGKNYIAKGYVDVVSIKVERRHAPLVTSFMIGRKDNRNN